MKLNILLLEDDNSQIDQYKEALEVNNLQDSYRLLPAGDIPTASDLIETNKVNAAILDLKVPKEEYGPANAEYGLEFLESLLQNKQFPVIVVSANKSSIPVDEINIPRHLEIMDREPNVHYNAFKHFEKIKDLLEISPLFPETIEDIHSEFQKSFWEMWGHWHKINSRFDLQNHDKAKTFLKRYVCSHLIEKWMTDDLFNEMHHSEFYTYPPPKERIHTGDILKLKNKYWIVITAPCDLSNDDFPDNLTLLRCQPIKSERIAEVVKPFKENLEEKRKNNQRKVVKRWFTDPSTSKHHLPHWTKNGKPFEVNFKIIKTKPFAKKKGRDKLISKRRAALSSHFLPYLLQRYGAYVSRIGQSDISTVDYIEYLSSLVHESVSKS